MKNDKIIGKVRIGRIDEVIVSYSKEDIKLVDDVEWVNVTVLDDSAKLTSTMFPVSMIHPYEYEEKEKNETVQQGPENDPFEGHTPYFDVVPDKHEDKHQLEFDYKGAYQQQLEENKKLRDKLSEYENDSRVKILRDRVRELEGKLEQSKQDYRLRLEDHENRICKLELQLLQVLSNQGNGGYGAPTWPYTYPTVYYTTRTSPIPNIGDKPNFNTTVTC